MLSRKRDQAFSGMVTAVRRFPRTWTSTNDSIEVISASSPLYLRDAEKDATIVGSDIEVEMFVSHTKIFTFRQFSGLYQEKNVNIPRDRESSLAMHIPIAGGDSILSKEKDEP